MDLPDKCKSYFNGVRFATLPKMGESFGMQHLTPPVAVKSSYPAAPGGKTGWLKTGQKADLVLGNYDFGRTGGPLVFNHPSILATDGKRLILPDTRNNRVLIWTSLPQGNVPPDLVLGQKDFDSSTPGTGKDQLNWPVAAATDGRHVVVSDMNNERVLIWSEFPTRNGQPADIVFVGGKRSDGRGLVGTAWALTIADGKLIMSNTRDGGFIMIYNQIPTAPDQLPDLVVNPNGDLSTPRFVGSDGKHLVVADYDPFDHKKGQGTFFWKEFPTRDDQPYDFFVSSPLKGIENARQDGEMVRVAFTPDGKLISYGQVGNLFIWNSFPADEKTMPDQVIGIKNGDPYSGYYFEGGDTSGIAVAGNTVYVSLMNSNKVVGYKTLPTKREQMPDILIGSPSLTANTLLDNFIITNPTPLSNGKNLFVSSDIDRRLYVWKQIPDRSASKPDYYYEFPESPVFLSFAGDGLVVSFLHTLVVWNHLPLNGEMPDALYGNQIGDVRYNSLHGVTNDDKYFYLADNGAGKVYIWEGRAPSPDRPPKFTLDVPGALRVSSDGKYVVITTMGGKTGVGAGFHVIPVDKLANDAHPQLIATTQNAKWSQAYHALVASGHLFIADTMGGTGNRVFVWQHIEDALAGKDPEVILGANDFTLPRPIMATQQQFHMPWAMSFDGSYLWVGEFKFSPMRLLRFTLGAP